MADMTEYPNKIGFVTINPIVPGLIQKKGLDRLVLVFSRKKYEGEIWSLKKISQIKRAGDLFIREKAASFSFFLRCCLFLLTQGKQGEELELACHCCLPFPALPLSHPLSLFFFLSFSSQIDWLERRRPRRRIAVEEEEVWRHGIWT